MPQMYPLYWMVMMPFSLVILFVFLVYIFYMKMYNNIYMKSKVIKLKLNFWEW